MEKNTASEKNSNPETNDSPKSENGQCGCAEGSDKKPASTDKQSCCMTQGASAGPTDEERNRSASRMILSLCCFVAAMYFYMVPSFFTANITDFLRGVLTATFLFAGLVVFQSKPEQKSR
jgi:hypothetical protein